MNDFDVDGWHSRYYPAINDFYCFMCDPQGAVIAKANSTSHEYSDSAYEAYRKEDVEYQNSNGAVPPAHRDPAGFDGQQGCDTDLETSLVLMGHRYYDPGTSKFLNRDPIGYGGRANLYAFADDNPVNESDPDGTSAASEVTIWSAKLVK